MHMVDALLSPVVGTAMWGISAAAVAYSAAKIKKDDLCERKVPVIGVMGAFVFAAQMINITIPGTGSSGHLGCGILLAAMLGSFPALLSITAVLIIQSLFFADGGLLALGCNIFNSGVIPCLVVYPLIYKPLVKKGLTAGRITAASIAAAIAGLQLGAFCVVLETLFSGIAVLPFSAFVLLMQPIHLAIGILEGILTAAVLCFVYKMRPEIMENSFERTAIKKTVSIRSFLVILALLTLLAGGFFSHFVSSYPDGLEWSIEKTAGTTELEVQYPFTETIESVQEKTAFMPDYGFKTAEKEGSGTALAGIVGSVFVFILAGISVFIISLVKKRKRT